MAALERLKVAAVQLVAQHLDASSAMREVCMCTALASTN